MRDIRNEKGTAKPDPAVMKRLIPARESCAAEDELRADVEH